MSYGSIRMIHNNVLDTETTLCNDVLCLSIASPNLLPFVLSLTRAPCQLARNSFSLNLFADPHPLTLLTSIFYKKGAGRGPATLTSLSHYLLTSSTPSPLSATLMDLPTQVLQIQDLRRKLNPLDATLTENTWGGSRLWLTRHPN